MGGIASDFSYCVAIQECVSGAEGNLWTWRNWFADGVLRLLGDVMMLERLFTHEFSKISQLSAIQLQFIMPFLWQVATCLILASVSASTTTACGSRGEVSFDAVRR